jgi:hypothetical protein
MKFGLGTFQALFDDNSSHINLLPECEIVLKEKTSKGCYCARTERISTTNGTSMDVRRVRWNWPSEIDQVKSTKWNRRSEIEVWILRDEVKVKLNFFWRNLKVKSEPKQDGKIKNLSRQKANV